MAISNLQNFYKETVAVACTTGATNIYVTTKPTPTNGYLVISSGTESLREIVKYTGTGTDGTGDYVTIASAGDRGLGGTTDQTHAVGETIRMNYTAQHQTEIDDAINAIVAGGAVDASTTNKGITKMSVAPASATEPIAVGDNDPRLNATTGLTADEEAALTGVNNTPDASNPLVTKDDLSDPTVLPPQVVTFTSSGTWTKDAGLKYVVVEGVGGGGGGATETAGSSGGGGGGGYFRKLILASALGATETVTIGAAGTAADPSGVAGGNTTFGAHATGNGGGGGTDSAGGAGGTATGGDLNIQGQDGSVAIQDGNQSSTSYDGAIGGSSQLGHGAIWGEGGVARGYGAGGKGGSEDTGAGGVGTAGIVIVTEYYS